jgi:hypothetical protein
VKLLFVWLLWFFGPDVLNVTFALQTAQAFLRTSPSNNKRNPVCSCCVRECELVSCCSEFLNNTGVCRYIYIFTISRNYTVIYTVITQRWGSL